MVDSDQVLLDELWQIVEESKLAFEDKAYNPAALGQRLSAIKLIIDLRHDDHAVVEEVPDVAEISAWLDGIMADD